MYENLYFTVPHQMDEAYERFARRAQEVGVSTVQREIFDEGYDDAGGRIRYDSVELVSDTFLATDFAHAWLRTIDADDMFSVYDVVSLLTQKQYPISGQKATSEFHRMVAYLEATPVPWKAFKQNLKEEIGSNGEIGVRTKNALGAELYRLPRGGNAENGFKDVYARGLNDEEIKKIAKAAKPA